MNMNLLRAPFLWFMQNFDGNDRNPPPSTFKKVILWQATTEQRAATPRHLRHFSQLLIADKGQSAT
jgi:hypothetical protein